MQNYDRVYDRDPPLKTTRYMGWAWGKEAIKETGNT